MRYRRRVWSTSTRISAAGQLGSVDTQGAPELIRFWSTWATVIERSPEGATIRPMQWTSSFQNMRSGPLLPELAAVYSAVMNGLGETLTVMIGAPQAPTAVTCAPSRA